MGLCLAPPGSEVRRTPLCAASNPVRLTRWTSAGWHWLTLDGTHEKVKVQRNALRLETPATQTQDPADQGTPPPTAKPKARQQSARPKSASASQGAFALDASRLQTAELSLYRMRRAPRAPEALKAATSGPEQAEQVRRLLVCQSRMCCLLLTGFERAGLW